MEAFIAFIILVGVLGSIIGVATFLDARQKKQLDALAKEASQANEAFGKACSTLNRAEVERLIANCNDKPTSTVLAGHAIIEKDAAAMPDEKQRALILSKVSADSLNLRITGVRSLLEEHYLPKAIAHQTDL
ncbi:MAG TPA: hypothetical protein V6C81_11700 [Planktothrix sp.]|jgi:hypothetical protein